MKTYKGPITNLQPNQSIIAGATSEERIKLFIKIANITPEKEYIIPYTAESTNLPGNLTIQELAQMFARQSHIPPNIIFEASFCDLVEEEKKLIENNT